MPKTKIVRAHDYLGRSTISDSEDAFLYGFDFCGENEVS